MLKFNIEKVSDKLKSAIIKKIDSKTKPIGSLGQLEAIACKIALIQDSLELKLNNPTIVVFASDHGIATAGVSNYPQEVTYQMVLNFLSGGAAINIFAKQHNINLKVVDAGVNYDFDKLDIATNGLIKAKIQMGSRNYISEKAMSEKECLESIQKGTEIVDNEYQKGCNIIGFGEMGIGNTSSAALLMSMLCNIPLEECIGRGTGLDDDGLIRKKSILNRVIAYHKGLDRSPISVLSTFGGFEIAMMTGAILRAAELKMIILIDGFITSSALLVASKINENSLDYSFFMHQSGESGHKQLLEHFNAKPILDLEMRLGEGTGVAIGYPIIQSAVHFFNEMASFDSAKVSQHV